MPHREMQPGLVSLTKIVATLGPASDSDEAITKLAEQGVSVFRLNFSHGSLDEHADLLARIRRVSERIGRPLAALGDLQGPKIRVGFVGGEGIEVHAGQDIVLSPDVDEAIDGDTPVLPCSYEPIVREVAPGRRILINDGAIRALAVEIASPTTSGQRELRLRITSGGRITTGRGINLPDSEVSAPAITEKDWRCVGWAIEHDIDFLALSFVREAADVRALKDRLRSICTSEDTCGGALSGDDNEHRIPIIAKIEKPQAVSNIEEILAEADGIMVARGDLGVEMDLAQAPLVQKRLIRAAHRHGKPCIVATQMLESMIEHSAPTRAEVSDVANAIFDGAGATMLSGETAVGQHTALAVTMMRRVAIATERDLRESPERSAPPAALLAERHRTASVAHGAWHMARDVGAAVVAVWSQRGGAARHLSLNNFRIPILAFSSDERAVRRMALLYAVTPILHLNPPEHRSEFARIVDEVVRTTGLAKPGERMVLLAGKPLGEPGVVNTVSIRMVGEMLSSEADD